MDFKALFSQLVVLYSKLSKSQRIIIGGAVATIAAFLAFLIIYASHSPSQTSYVPLFEKLSSTDANKVIQKLTKDNIPYLVKSNNLIEVPKNIVYKERIAIAAIGIPKNNTVGFELFNTQKFGATNFDQNIEYLRALEGELSRTVSALNPVENATVSLAIPKVSLFVQKQVAPTASVVVKLLPNMTLSPAQIRGIKNLVAASVPRLLVKNVTLVNSDGISLGSNTQTAQMGTAAAIQEQYTNAQEKLREHKIVNVIAPFVGGPNHVVAEVNIAYDFSKLSSKSEVYNPNNVVRSEQSVQIKRGGSAPASASGVPGAVSNISPIKNPTNNTSINKYSKSTDTTNYEISKTISSTTAQFARIKRITVAVVVDGKYRYKFTKAGKPTNKLEYIPLNQTQLSAIKSLVIQAAGLNLQRGDQVSVKNFEFKMINNQRKTTGIHKALSFYGQYIAPFSFVFKYLVVLLILFVLYKKVITPFAKEMLEISKEEESVKKPVLDFAEEDDTDLADKVQKMRKKVEEQLGVGDNFNEDGLKYDVLLEKLRAITEDHPEDIATLIQNLLSEEISAHSQKPKAGA